MKFLKQALSLLLCALMMVSAIPMTGLAAGGATNVTMSVEKTEVNVGDTFTVTLSCSDMAVASFAAGIRFDTALLECTNIVGARSDIAITASLPYLKDVLDEWVKGTSLSKPAEANKTGSVGFVYANTDDWWYVEQDFIIATFKAKAAGAANITAYEKSDGTAGFIGDADKAVVTILEAAPATYALHGDAQADGLSEGDDLTDILASAETKDGYTFVKWNFYKDAAKTQPVALTDNKMPAHDLYVYGEWEKIPYTIKFYDGDTEKGEATEDADGNATIIGNLTSNDKHKTFKGWSATKGATTADSKYTAGAKIALTADLTLYAVWETTTCAEGETKDHKCDVCQKVLTYCKDSLEATAANPATCITPGNEAYWTCTVCGDHYKDADANTGWDEGGWIIPVNSSNHEKPNDFTYEDNKDGATHIKKYACCGAVAAAAESHTYPNGECVCEAVQTFTIRFHVGNTVYNKGGIAYGTVPACGESTAKAADKDGHYTFAGWATTEGGAVLSALPAATADADYYAVYTTTAHNYVTETARTDATCSATGSVTKKCNIDNCAFTDTQTLAIDENAHKWGTDVSYGWAGDGSSCTATRACELNGEHKDTANAKTITRQVVEEANCTTAGDTEYTATFDEAWAGSDKKTVADNIPTNNVHNYVNGVCTRCHDKLSYTITFQKENGEEISFVSYEVGAAVSATYPAYTKQNYTISWDKDIPTTMPAANVVIKAVATPNEYTIDFGGTKLTANVGNDWTVEVPADPAQTGYSFVGWATTENAAEADTNYKAGDEVAFTESKTFYPVFTANTYTLTINLGEHGTFADGKNTAEVKAAYATVPEYPAFTANEGYKLTGWQFAGNSVSLPETMPATDREYTAVWELVDVTVKFVDGTSEESKTGDYFSKVTAPALSKEGHTFLGWDNNTDATDTEVLYKAGDEITLNKDVPATLYAKWQVNTYKVIYKVNDQQVHEDSVAYGAAVTAWTYTPDEGYNFSGWSQVPVTMPAKDVTVTGTTTIKSYTITWNDDAGNLIDTTTVKHGETPTHADPTKAETAQYTYTFAGWTPEVVAATKDATYTANFTDVLRSYDITFVVDGQENKVVSVPYGQTPSYGGTPSKATNAYYSYEFKGWDPALKAVEGEAIYTATWTETPVEHTITFVIDGETFYQVKGDYDTAADYSEMPSTERSGYSFAWDKAETEWPATIPGEDIVITGTYTPNTYTITFKGDFNTEKDDAFADYTITKDFGAAITADDIAALNAKLPTITGWEFLGWYNAEEVEIEGNKVWKYTSEYDIPEKMLAGDVTVYAQWDEIEYTMSVLSSIDNTEIASVSMRYGEEYSSLDEFNYVNSLHYDDSGLEDGHENLLPAGYSFNGYKYENGNEVTFPYSQAASDVTIVAQFKPVDYTITFMNGDTEVDEITAPYGSEITLPENPTKEGYKFAGWVDDEGKAVNLTTIPLGDMTVYATFTVDTFKVNFYATEGDATAHRSFEVAYGTDLNGAEDDPETPEIESAPNVLAELLAQVAAPSKTGYSWNGWNASNVPEIMPAEAVNIYGTWSVNYYTVNWVIDGETYKTDSVAYGDTITAPEPTKEGHTFSGWSKIPASMPAETVTVTGSWNVNTYTITFDTDGGNPETIDSITAEYGSEITWPSNPTKTGHLFWGWDKDNDGDNDVSSLSEMPAENLNLQAVWMRMTAWIYWNVEGVETGKEYKYGDPIEVPENPTKAADAKWTYKFIGWKNTSEELVEFPQNVTENTTYYAVFEQDQAVKYSVKFVDGENTLYETQVAWNGEVTLDGFEVPTMTGNTLSWTVDGSEVTFPYNMTTEEVTFVAKWTPITYTITVDGVEHPFTYGAAVSIADPSKEGHKFNGWLKDGVEGYYTLPATMPAEDIVITSDWTVNTYALTVSSWDADGKYVEKTETVPYGAKLSKYYLETPAHTVNGMLYEFQEWDAWTWSNNDDDTMVEYTGATMPASDVKMYSTYTITGWDTDEDGNTTYYVKSEFKYFNEWATIDGADYWFDGQSYIAKDITLIDGSYHAFDHEDGKFLSDLTGIYTAQNGDLYYVENGVAVKNKGLVQVDDPAVEDGHLYYYFGCAANGCSAANCAGEYKAQKNTRHWAEITNGYLMACGYTFGDDGIIEHIDNTAYEGVYTIDGVKYYLMDGVKVHKGLFMIGDDYYYARSSGALVVSDSYWVSKSKLNDLEFKEGTYNFDADGKIIFAAKNGFYKEDSVWRYYEDGKLCYKGLYWFDGTGAEFADDWQPGPTANDPGYYYINSRCELIVDCDYWISKNNGYMRNKTYSFDENGTMYTKVVALKSGIYAEGGSLYYYVDGSRNYAGLIQYTGDLNNADGSVTAGVYNNDYIYVNTQGEVKNNCTYWVSKTNGLMIAMSYTFDANGIMTNPYVADPLPDGKVKNGIIAENGSLYYYEDGVLTYAGLIQIDGDYYYVKTSGEVIHGRSYWISKNNGLMKNGMYTFDESGVMLDPRPISG